MDFDYGPALPPCLNSRDSCIDDASSLHLSAVEEPSRLPSTLPKESSHSHKQHAVASSSALDHYFDHTKDSRPALSRP